MYPPEGDLRPKQDKEASMQEMRVGIKIGFWFRVLKSERGGKAGCAGVKVKAV